MSGSPSADENTVVVMYCVWYELLYYDMSYCVWNELLCMIYELILVMFWRNQRNLISVLITQRGISPDAAYNQRVGELSEWRVHL